VAKLYIANCSKQNFLLTYMLPENTKPFIHEMRPGTQVELNHSPDEVASIIRQHELYGMHPADKVTKGFGGRCYRLDRPISVEAIEQGISQTDEEAIKRATIMRQAAVAAGDAALEQAAESVGARQVAPLQVEITEDRKDPTDTGPKFGETITLDKPNLPGDIREKAERSAKERRR
jgi:hypothetical protein